MAYPLWLAKLLIRTGIAQLLPSVRRLAEGGTDFLHYYNDRILLSPHAELREMARMMESQRPDMLDLSLGAPRFDLLPSGTTKLPAGQRGYPPPLGLMELRKLIAAKLQDDNDLNVSPTEEVLVTNGSSAALSIALDTFINRGDRVILFDPCYLAYPLAVRNRGGRILWIPTTMERGQVRYDIAKLVEGLRHARLVILNSPANPTGAVISPGDLEQIAWWADRFDVLIFSDEVYERYQYDGRFVSIGSFLKARKRTLTANSLSKSHALAAYRIGWLAAHRHLVRPCTATAALQCPFVPTICQHLALAALRLPSETFVPIWKEFESKRRYVFERLQSMGLAPEWPAGAFFVWVPVDSTGLTGSAFAEKLLREGVVIVPGKLFGPSGQNYIRISYAADEGRVMGGMNRLAEFVGSLSSVSQAIGLKKAA